MQKGLDQMESDDEESNTPTLYNFPLLNNGALSHGILWILTSIIALLTEEYLP